MSHIGIVAWLEKTVGWLVLLIACHRIIWLGFYHIDGLKINRKNLQFQIHLQILCTNLTLPSRHFRISTCFLILNPLKVWYNLSTPKTKLAYKRVHVEDKTRSLCSLLQALGAYRSCFCLCMWERSIDHNLPVLTWMAPMGQALAG